MYTTFHFYLFLFIFIAKLRKQRTNFDKSCNKKISFNNTSNIRPNRLLYGESNADSQEAVFNLKKYFKDDFENSSNSLVFKDNSENTYDSLSSIDYLDEVNEELKKKPIQRKKYKLTENNISPLTSPHTNRLDSQFETELPEQLHNEHKRSNIFTRKSKEIITRKTFKDFTPYILSSLFLIMSTITEWSWGIHISYVLLLLSVLYLFYRIFNNINKGFDKISIILNKYFKHTLV
ncbi:Plasmodium exported protein, unknown function [Plasmodium malariae]|uniref:Pv-fam-d protein n=1 Tax=Plasmodium malariae TaxID=5858 RepID=A0A1D3TDJ5_PLAMA|nr:Plasmodium exported protein, unknown function [Plasmodium malariae]SCP02961.1 Plasmodium exported protein, unknown function [Plasmodium malariae]